MRPPSFTSFPEPGVLTIPAYRESHRLPRFLQELLPALTQLGMPLRLQIVDDGSPAPEVERLRACLPTGDFGLCSVSPLLQLPRNTRKGGAILAGWQAHPQAAWYAFVDADGAVPAAEVARLLRSAQELPPTQASLLIGVRDAHAGLLLERDRLRALASRLFNHLATRISLLRLPDFQCGLKYLTAPAWRTLASSLQGFGLCFDVELIAKAQRAHIAIHPFPIRWQERKGGSIRLPLDAPAMLLQLLRLALSLPPQPTR